MASIMSHYVRRQVNNDMSDPDYCPWWYCDQTAYIIKWIVVGVLFVLILGFVLAGHYHAKRRMAKGLPPLRYHRWLVSRQARARFPVHGRPQPVNGVYVSAYAPGGHQQSYPMNNYGYAPPPPAYHEAEAAPVYTPPTKVNPDQSYAVPPQGPPPAGYNPQAGSSNLNAPAPPPRAASPFNNNSNR